MWVSAGINTERAFCSISIRPLPSCLATGYQNCTERFPKHKRTSAWHRAGSTFFALLQSCSAERRQHHHDLVPPLPCLSPPQGEHPASTALQGEHPAPPSTPCAAAVQPASLPMSLCCKLIPCPMVCSICYALCPESSRQFLQTAYLIHTSERQHRKKLVNVGNHNLRLWYNTLLQSCFQSKNILRYSALPT